MARIGTDCFDPLGCALQNKGTVARGNSERRVILGKPQATVAAEQKNVNVKPSWVRQFHDCQYKDKQKCQCIIGQSASFNHCKFVIYCRRFKGAPWCF